ncbi:MAG: hypothetical protein JNL80_04735 [Phycisphaerae bacterium]|jgi:hypothetical protein|nr:hypothetical protein [Phycisphaerae bacterium]
MSASRLFRAACTAGLTASILAGPARADVTNRTYVNSNTYDYRITYMTDIDQKRTGLGGNGAMYCVPTACFNLFAYAANHGFPVGGLPPANYMSSGQYGYVTTWLDFIGDLMQTDAQDGTTCCVTDAYQSLVNGSLMKRTTKYITSEYTPGQATATQLACNGWIVSFTYGKYTNVGSLKGYPIYDRGGGHAVTLTRSYRWNGERIIRYRDPNNESSLTTQSGHSNKEYVPTTITGWIDGHGLRNMTKLFTDGGKLRLIDALHAIRPLYGIRFNNSDDAQGGGSIDILDPIPFEGSEDAMVPSIPISPFLSVYDVIIHPDGASGLMITKSIIVGTSSLLRTIDLSTGQMTTIPDAPTNLVRMDWSGKNRIYAFDTSGVLHYLTGEGSPVGTMPTIPTPSALAVDDANNAVWLVSVAQRKLVKLNADTLAVQLLLDIPTSVPMSGDADLIFDPNSGLPWMRTDASTTLYGIKPNSIAAPTIYSANLGTINSISMSDDRLYVGGSSGIKVYKPAVAAPGWTFDGTSPFNGLPGGSRLAMLRNSDNYDPKLHSGPQWQNLTTEELAEPSPDVLDCFADANDDGTVDAADLSILLGAWGGTDDVGDLNQDGTVDAADLAALLGAWGTCPR